MSISQSIVTTVVSLSWQQASYTVEEGLRVLVCAEIESGVLDRPVSLGTIFTPLSAQG